MKLRRNGRLRTFAVTFFYSLILSLTLNQLLKCCGSSLTGRQSYRVVSPLSKYVGDKFWNGTFRDVKIKYTINPRDYCNVFHATDALARYFFPGRYPRPLVILVTSMPKQFAESDFIRTTWASVRTKYKKVIFCLGVAATEIEQSWVDGEVRRYGDILQFELFESYRNLAYKTYFMLTWAAWYCDKDSFIMKTDTDTLVWLEGLAKFRDVMRNQTNRIWGSCGGAPSSWVEGGVPFRRGKWAVTYQEWPFTNYPTFCSGTGYIMSGDVPPLLVEASKYQDTYFPLEDVMFNGIAAERANVTRHAYPGFYPGGMKRCRPDTITSHMWSAKLQMIEHEWKSYHRRCRLYKNLTTRQ